MTRNDHGQSSTYENHGCRCAACKTAHAEKNAAAHRRRKADGKAAGYDKSKHGVKQTYDDGCRCEPCRAANAAASRKHRAAKKQREAK